MKKAARHLHLLSSPAFIIGLLLLLLNDHYLKQEYHNWLTGKLSDVAGLFIFPIFWLALFPRHKKFIFAATAIGFAWWKSPLAGGFLHFWNGLQIYPLQRVVDWTDLFGLLMLIPAWRYTGKNFSYKAFAPVKSWALVGLAFLAFCGSAAEPRHQIYPLDHPAMIAFEADSASVGELIKYDSLEATSTYLPLNIWHIIKVRDMYISYLNEITAEGLMSEKGELRDNYWLARQKENAIQERLSLLRLKHKDYDKRRENPLSSEGVKFHIASDINFQDSLFNKKLITEFKKGVPDGDLISYWPGNILHIKGQYRNGLEDGVFERWDKLGKKLSTIEYDNGEKQKLTRYNLFFDGEVNEGDTTTSKRTHTFLIQLLIMALLLSIPVGLYFFLIHAEVKRSIKYAFQPRKLFRAAILPAIVFLWLMAVVADHSPTAASTFMVAAFVYIVIVTSINTFSRFRSYRSPFWKAANTALVNSFILLIGLSFCSLLIYDLYYIQAGLTYMGIALICMSLIFYFISFMTLSVYHIKVFYRIMTCIYLLSLPAVIQLGTLIQVWP